MKLAVVVIIGTILGHAGFAQESVIINGSFESPAVLTTKTLRVSSLPGWWVSDSVNMVRSDYWEATNGVQSLEIAGNIDLETEIAQDFGTFPGRAICFAFITRITRTIQGHRESWRLSEARRS
ncbi:MAG TPA: hypothetical protein VK615_02015 [Candidatus Binatia bacterium]|nr:hypothetical protein [Candidatus Binatia bacterium]